MARSIAVVEPQMDNLFHAPFNAALLHAVVLAYPEVRVSFSAFDGHMRAVLGILARYAPEIRERVELRVLTVRQGHSIVERWLANQELFKQVLGRRSKVRERVLLCSVSRMQLLQLKRMMRAGDQVRAVLHGDLDRIEQPVTERFPASLFALQKVLVKSNKGDLRYVLLSDSIRAHVPEAYRPAMASAGVIDHPYHFADFNEAVGTHAQDGPVVFGLLGNSGEARLFEQVARAVKARRPEIEFRIVGFLANEETVARISPLADGAGMTPIAQEEFIRRMAGVTYVLWLAAPDSFRLRASGTFLDALAYAKPLVFTANPYIDAYFREAPGIGVRCERVEDVAGAVIGLAEGFTGAGYASAQAAMVGFRERFAPEALAGRLAGVLGWGEDDKA